MTQYRIDTIAFGGDGVSRVDGLVFFIPFTLPGELVEAEISQKKQNFAKAKLLTILEASPHRIDPLCPYFSQCGGCQIQHADYSLQLELKKRFIEDSLKRIGNIEYKLSCVAPSPRPFGYRRHITLKIKQIDNVFKLGFTSVDNQHLPIDSCFLFHIPGDRILQNLQEIFSQLSPQSPSAEVSVKVFKTPNQQYFIACDFSYLLSSADIKILKEGLASCRACSGWHLKTPKQIFEFGDSSFQLIYRNLVFFYSPFSFVQNHPEQSEKIYDWLIEINSSSKRILDLYCGIGISSLALAQKGKKVLGVEVNPVSIKLAMKSATYNQLEEVQFLCAPVEDSTEDLLASFEPDSIIMNPPKAGASPDVLEALSRSPIKNISYISCNPTTLARDLSYLIKKGFVLDHIKAFDMFPQTTHVECAVQLTR